MNRVVSSRNLSNGALIASIFGGSALGITAVCVPFGGLLKI